MTSNTEDFGIDQGHNHHTVPWALLASFVGSPAIFTLVTLKHSVSDRVVIYHTVADIELSLGFNELNQSIGLN